MSAASSPVIEAFFDPQTWTFSYVVSDAGTQRAAIIDAVLDYDFKSGQTNTASSDKLFDYVKAQGLTVDWLLETHAHADHLSGAHYLKDRLGQGKIAIGEHIREVQATFKEIFNLERDFLPDGRQFDHLFKDNETFQIGGIQAFAWHVPGHTPADMAYVIGDAAFVGDTLFMPDVGTARADFPGGDAHVLYQSIRRILAMPPDTRIFVCHDYPPEDRKTEPARYLSTVAAQRASNIHVRDGITEEAFVSMRKARDATLEMPTLILPSIQVNVRAGELPPAEDNGVRYLKVPLNALGR